MVGGWTRADLEWSWLGDDQSTNYLQDGKTSLNVSNADVIGTQLVVIYNYIERCGAKAKQALFKWLV